MTPHTDTLNCHEAPHAVRALDKHLGELFDAADARDRRTRIALNADDVTRKARNEIKAIAEYLSGPQACALISEMVAAFSVSRELKTSTSGQAAQEHLLDAFASLED
jgi:hypothetical protein